LKSGDTLSVTNISNALRKYLGVVVAVCQELQISERTYYRLEKKHPELIQLRKEIHQPRCKVSINLVKESLRKNHGVITATCKDLKIDRDTYYKWERKHPDLKQLHGELHENLIDVAETRLFEKIENGDTTCIIFFLKTRGRARGYAERYNPDNPSGTGTPSVNISYNPTYEAV